ncbi:MAG: HlyD family type I secretion periplasmic adaptor subunit [bacterium]|jgi:HlyD family type I secretion membrane fusion protein|nr:HlyD family type I secretion periplasmic adaptor subunit [Betaproteobacteria bacterium]
MNAPVQASAQASGVPARPVAPPPPPDADYRRPVRLGVLMLVVGLGGFLLWAALAPIDEGVPAAGVVAVESKRKRVDHLTGGLIERILVRDGQVVAEGDPLVELNETQAKAALNAIEGEWRVAAATAARLEAERAGARSIAFPKALLDAAGDPEAAAAMRTQSELFRSRQGALAGELAIVRESVRGLELQMKSLERVMEGRALQIRLFTEQYESFLKLHAEKFVSRNQLIDIERQLAEVQTKQSEDLARMAEVGARLSEFRMRGAQREIEYRREVEALYAEVQKVLATLGERLTAQRDTVRRLVLRAPSGGTVIDLAYSTLGGVIKPGDRILDIVPDGDELIIEAQVPPQYIDRLVAGQPADVHFDAYMSRVDRPVLTGTVKVVSADALVDPRTGIPYYAMRVAVSGAELKRLGDIRVQPGMQATVMVKTGERSLLAYLTRPLLRRFQGALGET